MSANVSFARRVFLWAGIYGVLVLAPQYLLEQRMGVDYPPPITHPEFFYGFTGVGLAWQFAFIVMSRDVVRFRPLMPAACAEKFLFFGSTFALYLSGRVALPFLGVATIDLMLGILFAISYVRLASAQGSPELARG